MKGLNLHLDVNLQFSKVSLAFVGGFFALGSEDSLFHKLSDTSSRYVGVNFLGNIVFGVDIGNLRSSFGSKGESKNKCCCASELHDGYCLLLKSYNCNL